MIGGYAGYYNNMALDSSYEYIYCKILEEENKIFDVHVKSYDLGYKQYTPDFFIYDSNGNIKEIIEVRGARLNLSERIKDLKELETKYQISTKIITEIDLRKECPKLGLSYNKLKVEWRTNPENTKNKQSGEFNAMYSKHHTKETKMKLSVKGKERMKDPKYIKAITSKMIQWNIDNNFEQTKRPRSKRVEKICLACNKPFIVTEAKAKLRSYCSQSCGCLIGVQKASEQLTANRIVRHDIIKEIAIEFTINNQEAINNIKLNKIESNECIIELTNKIFEATGIIDFRIIGEAICGKQSRKEMVKYLKNIENQNK